MGDTRYRWEGDTLVADVAALTDQPGSTGPETSTAPTVHVVERYRMTGPDTIEYEARIEDPEVYSKPWTLRTDHRVKDRRPDHRGRVSRGRERRPPSYFAVRSPELAEIRLLALETATAIARV